MSLDALVIGAGPAGLMAAEVLSAGGVRVVIAEAMPTPARKFLMAGKSGLNLTKDEPRPAFISHFFGSCARSAPDATAAAPVGYLGMEDFASAEVMAWAEGLGIRLFAGSTGRVFPVGMKGSPLLRAWLARLDGQEVQLRKRWRWSGFEDGAFRFETPEGTQVLRPQVAVLALGGASWPKLGSDGAWVEALRGAGVGIADFRPANMGFRVDWSAQMARHFGAAVKGVAIHVAGRIGRGEWVVTQGGIEGGGIYELSAAIRDGAPATVDLAPDLKPDVLASRLAKAPAKLSLGNRLRRVLGDPVHAALALEWGRPLPADAGALAALLKALPLHHAGPAGLERAISSAGGIGADALNADLSLKALPHVFAAGEMLDWEAPTGGYLLTGSIASGRKAGQGALAYLDKAR